MGSPCSGVPARTHLGEERGDGRARGAPPSDQARRGRPPARWGGGRGVLAGRSGGRLARWPHDAAHRRTNERDADVERRIEHRRVTRGKDKTMKTKIRMTMKRWLAAIVVAGSLVA